MTDASHRVQQSRRIHAETFAHLRQRWGEIKAQVLAESAGPPGVLQGRWFLAQTWAETPKKADKRIRHAVGRLLADTQAEAESAAELMRMLSPADDPWLIRVQSLANGCQQASWAFTRMDAALQHSDTPAMAPLLRLSPSGSGALRLLVLRTCEHMMGRCLRASGGSEHGSGEGDHALLEAVILRRLLVHCVRGPGPSEEVLAATSNGAKSRQFVGDPLAAELHGAAFRLGQVLHAPWASLLRPVLHQGLATLLGQILHWGAAIDADMERHGERGRALLTRLAAFEQTIAEISGRKPVHDQDRQGFERTYFLLGALLNLADQQDAVGVQMQGGVMRASLLNAVQEMQGCIGRDLGVDSAVFALMEHVSQETAEPAGNEAPSSQKHAPSMSAALRALVMEVRQAILDTELLMQAPAAADTEMGIPSTELHESAALDVVWH